MPSHARRSGPKPSFDPPMKAEDEEKVDFNLWKAGIPELQVIPPVVRYASGMVRAMTPRVWVAANAMLSGSMDPTSLSVILGSGCFVGAFSPSRVAGL